MNPTDVHCPKCKAAPGEKCKNDRGKNKPPCKERKRAVNPTGEHMRQATLKTKREQAKVQQQVPLFAEQVEVATPIENYWRTRMTVAGTPGSGGDEKWQPRAGFNEDIVVMVLKRLAREVLPAAAYESFCGRRWVNYEVMFWTDLLTTTKPLVGTYERVSHGWNPCFRTPYLVCCGHGCRKCEAKLLVYIERTTLIPTYSWPPDGWTPPYTREQIDAILSVPPPRDHAGAVDPMNVQQSAAN